jgi:hypothetical protein
MRMRKNKLGKSGAEEGRERERGEKSWRRMMMMGKK